MDKQRRRIYSSNTQNSVPTSSSAAVAAPFEPSDSGSNSSVDSGQGSAEFSSQSFSSRDLFDYENSLGAVNLPSYARMANTMDHALRVCSALHTVLCNEIDAKWTSELVCKGKILVAIMQSSPSRAFLPAQVSALHRYISSPT
ncbi:unnamed protein product [Gongylonema pulchrum]|uniref:DHR-2 domain-containing protein n=1 Tax=Gongylonema pulchrum TaxID=637853 RepID=A0A183EEL7_9BILA|nr:unnamed protein product [Gongylonema pulchrum]